MILSDTPLSPHYIIANCFQPQRAEAVNGYKSRYITRQRSINNAWSQMPQITPRTGVTDISSHPVPVSSAGSRELGTWNSPSIIFIGRTSQSPALMAMRRRSLLSCCKRVPVYSSGADTGSTSCWGNSKTSGLLVVVCLGWIPAGCD